MREEKIKRIKELHAEMRELTIQFARVSEKRYDRLIEKVDLFNDHEIECMTEWLTWLRTGTYAGVLRVYRMPPNPKVTWANYVTLGIQGLQEQNLMEIQASLLRTAWQSPYKPERVIRVEKVNKAVHEAAQGNDSGISDRPEGHRPNEGDR